MSGARRENGTDARIRRVQEADARVGDAAEELGFWRRLRLWSERLAAAKTLVGATLLVLAGVGAGAIYLQGTVRRDELAPLATSDRDQDLRLALIERDLDWIKRTLYRVAERSGAAPTKPPERTDP